MTEKSISVGDSVRLASGGAGMTVVSISNSGLIARVMYFESRGEIRGIDIPVAALRRS